MQSIFTDVGKLSLQDPAHSFVIPTQAGQTGSPSTSTAWLNHQGEAQYALASPAGGILVVTLPPHDLQGMIWSLYSGSQLWVRVEHACVSFWFKPVVLDGIQLNDVELITKWTLLTLNGP